MSATAAPAAATGRRGSETGWRVELALIVCAVAGINIGLTGIIPFLPTLASDLNLTTVPLMAFMFAIPASKLVFQLVGGSWADRWTPGGVLVTAAAVGAVGMVATTAATGAAMGIASRLLWGAGGGLAVPAMYRATTLLAQRHGEPTTKLLSRLMAFAVLAAAAGPAVGGLYHTLGYGWREVLVTSSVLCVAGSGGAGMMFLRHRASTPHSTRTTAHATSRQNWRAVYVFGLVSTWGWLMFTAIEPLIPFRLAAAGVGEHDAGQAAVLLTAYMATFTAVLLAAGSAPARVRSARAGVAAFATLGAVAMTMPWALDVQLLSVAAVGAAGAALASVFMVAREGIVNNTDGSGRVWARFGVTSDLGAVAGPLAALWLFDHYGADAFTVLGVTTIGVAAIFSWTFARRPLRLEAVGEPHDQRNAPPTTLPAQTTNQSVGS